MTVYNVKDNKGEIERGTVNVIPSAINFTGVVPNGTSNWNQYMEIEPSDNDTSTETPVNYLRGRKLVGKVHDFSSYGYEGVLFERAVQGQEPGTQPGTGDDYVEVTRCPGGVLYAHQVGPGIVSDQLLRAAEWATAAAVLNSTDS